MKYTTIDIDGLTRIPLVRKLTAFLKKEYAYIKIMYKYSLDIEEFEVKKSQSGLGYHIELVTKNNLDKEIRSEFDDQARYTRDINRPEYAQNVLFDSKEIKIIKDVFKK